MRSGEPSSTQRPKVSRRGSEGDKKSLLSRIALIDCLTVCRTANVKFPEGTVAGMYKAAVAAKPEYDCVRFDSQRINWTLKELDVS